MTGRPVPLLLGPWQGRNITIEGHDRKAAYLMAARKGKNSQR